MIHESALSHPSRDTDRARSSPTRGRRLLAFTLVSAFLVTGTQLPAQQGRILYGSNLPDMQDSIAAHPGWKIRHYPSKGGVQYASYIHDGSASKPTVVYFHGRGENMNIVSGNVAPYVNAGWNVIIPEYPGLAGLAGSPSEKGFSELVDKVYADIRGRDIPFHRIFIHGNSLGSGPALQMAQKPNYTLVLSAPFASLEALKNHYAPIYPTSMLKEDWNNVERAHSRWRSPALIFHSTDDLIIPYEQGKAVAGSAVATVYKYTDKGHNISYVSASYLVNELYDAKHETVRAFLPRDGSNWSSYIPSPDECMVTEPDPRCAFWR